MTREALPPIHLSGRIERLGSFAAQGAQFLSLSLRCGDLGGGRLAWLRAPLFSLPDEDAFVWSLLRPGDALEVVAQRSADGRVDEMLAFWAPGALPKTARFERAQSQLASGAHPEPKAEPALNLAPAIAPSAVAAPNEAGADAAPASSLAPPKIAGLPAAPKIQPSPRPARTALSPFEAEEQAWGSASLPRRLYVETLAQILAEIDSEKWREKALARMLWGQGIELFGLASADKDAAANLVAEMSRSFRSLNAELSDRSSARRANALLEAAFRWASAEPRSLEPAPSSEDESPMEAFRAKQRENLPAPPENAEMDLALAILDQHQVRLEQPGGAPNLAEPLIFGADGFEPLGPPPPVFKISETDANEASHSDNHALDDLLELAARAPDPLILAQTGLEDPSWSGAVERFVDEHAPEIGQADRAEAEERQRLIERPARDENLSTRAD